MVIRVELVVTVVVEALDCRFLDSRFIRSTFKSHLQGAAVGLAHRPIWLCSANCPTLGMAIAVARVLRLPRF